MLDRNGKPLWSLDYSKCFPTLPTFTFCTQRQRLCRGHASSSAIQPLKTTQSYFYAHTLCHSHIQYTSSNLKFCMLPKDTSIAALVGNRTTFQLDELLYLLYPPHRTDRQNYENTEVVKKCNEVVMNP